MRRITPWLRAVFTYMAAELAVRLLLPGDRLTDHPDIERASEVRPEIQAETEAMAPEIGVDDATIYLWEFDVPNMFIFGHPGHAHIVVTSAALEALAEDEALATIGHEIAHARQHHTLTIGSILLGGLALTGAVYAGVGRRRCRRTALVVALSVATVWWLLSTAVVREFERAADLTGGVAVGNGEDLANALVTVYSGGQSDASPENYEPEGRTLIQRLIATHPPISERIDYLVEE